MDKEELRKKVVQYHDAHPRETITAIAERFGVSRAYVSVWCGKNDRGLNRKIVQYRRDHPQEPQKSIAAKFGVSLPYVSVLLAANAPKVSKYSPELKRNVIRYYNEHPNETNKAIAARFGVPYTKISEWCGAKKNKSRFPDDLCKRAAKLFNRRPKLSTDEVMRALGLPKEEFLPLISVLRSRGAIEPRSAKSSDPKHIKPIKKFAAKHPFDTPKQIARKFDVTIDLAKQAIQELAAEGFDRKLECEILVEEYRARHPNAKPRQIANALDTTIENVTPYLPRIQVKRAQLSDKTLKILGEIFAKNEYPTVRTIARRFHCSMSYASDLRNVYRPDVDWQQVYLKKKERHEPTCVKLPQWYLNELEDGLEGVRLPPKYWKRYLKVRSRKRGCRSNGDEEVRL